jgi:hypothetical protein
VPDGQASEGSSVFPSATWEEYSGISESGFTPDGVTFISAPPRGPRTSCARHAIGNIPPRRHALLAAIAEPDVLGTKWQLRSDDLFKPARSRHGPTAAARCRKLTGPASGTWGVDVLARAGERFSAIRGSKLASSDHFTRPWLRINPSALSVAGRGLAIPNFYSVRIERREYVCCATLQAEPADLGQRFSDLKSSILFPDCESGCTLGLHELALHAGECRTK